MLQSDSSIRSVGIGLTNRCNLNCPHCYSRQMLQNSLHVSDVLMILQKLPNLGRVNFGTGESILNEDFQKIIEVFKAHSTDLSLTTNGLTVSRMDDAQLASFKDIDFSLDFPKAELHDRWRAQPGVFDLVIQGLQRCAHLDVNVSIAICLMNINYQYLREFRKLADRFNCFLRINIYKPVKTDKFALSYEEFWEAMRILADNFSLVSNSEPILSVVTGDHIRGSPCGKSIRIHPDMTASACVYLDGITISVEHFREQKLRIPDFCQKCAFADNCRGGCLGRRYLMSRFHEPDSYCPFTRQDKLPLISFERAGKMDLIHSEYLCTIIVR